MGQFRFLFSGVFQHIQDFPQHVPRQIRSAPVKRQDFSFFYRLLRALGADVVYDTNLTADLTIMEESAEFLEKVKTGAKHK